MSGKNWLTGYFSFTRKELIALLLIILVLAATMAIPHFFTASGNEMPVQNDTAWLSVVKQLEITSSQKQHQDSSDNNPEQHSFQGSSNSYFTPSSFTLFYFDPNTLAEMDWKKLGIKDKTIKTILNYRSKGGTFKKPEDLKKIYGLSIRDYERLLPYVQIETKSYDYKNQPETKPATIEKHNKIIDINTADSAEWVALPGIGPVLSSRIINFRKKLGGFYSIDQLKETYGLPDSTFQKIKPSLRQGSTTVRKININTATVEELKAHPYISNNLAKLIIAYRNEHGSFVQLEDVQKIAVVTQDIYRKMMPYMTLE